MTKAVIVELLGQPKGEPITFNVNNATAVEKGSLMFTSGTGRVASGSAAATGNNVVFAGIAATEKEASDGATTLGLWTKGVFDIICDTTTFACGNLVVISGADAVTGALNIGSISGGHTVGKALEDGVAGSAAQIAVGIY